MRSEKFEIYKATRQELPFKRWIVLDSHVSLYLRRVGFYTVKILSVLSSYALNSSDVVQIVVSWPLLWDINCLYHCLASQLWDEDTRGRIVYIWCEWFSPDVSILRVRLWWDRETRLASSVRTMWGLFSLLCSFERSLCPFSGLVKLLVNTVFLWKGISKALN